MLVIGRIQILFKNNTKITKQNMKTLIQLLKNINRIRKKYTFNYLKTLIINFKLLSFRDALHFPIIIYGNVELNIKRSKLIIIGEKSFGMMAIGRNDDVFVPTSSKSLLLILDSTIIIKGYIRISPGSVLRLDHTVLELNDNVVFGGGCKILSNEHIVIGQDTWFAFGCIICDTDYHFIECNDIIKNCTGEIIIGNYCWIGNNTTISKHTILPNWTIVGSKSLVCKDFRKYGENLLIAGMPADIKKKDCKKIIDQSYEKELKMWFKKSGSPIYIMSSKS